MRRLLSHSSLLALLVLHAAPVRSAPAASARSSTASFPADKRLASIKAPLEALMARLERKGIDTGPLRSKLREGLAKGVGPRRLLQVVTRYGAHLIEGDRVTRRTYKRKVPQGLPRAYADARLAGVQRKRLERLLKVLSPKHRRLHAVVAVDALTDLLARGHLSQAAYGMVLGLARKGRFKDILKLRGILARVRKRYGLSLPRAGVELQKALIQTDAHLPAALDRLDRELPVADPATSTRGVSPAAPGRGGRGP
jgi:hypothetical protein